MKQSEMPPYSVLMSVYKKDDPTWLEVAMKSMLEQTLPPYEFILVEDGPLPQTLRKVIAQKRREYPHIVRCVQLRENQGLGLALRRGVEECRCEWIARMDADDYAKADRVEKQMAAALSQGADIVGSDIYEFENDISQITTLRTFPEEAEELNRFARRKTPFAHQSVLMKKSRVLAAGNYADAYLHEDYDLFLRMIADGCRGYTVKEPLVFARVNDNYYERRGGFFYLCTMLRFNCHSYRKGWIGAIDFLVRSCGNILVCSVPNRARVWIYKRCLRRRIVSAEA